MKREVPERISIYDVRDSVAEYYGIDSREPAWRLLYPVIIDAQHAEHRRFEAARSAMQGLLSNLAYVQFFGSNLIGTPPVAETVARDSVAHADAMLAWLNKEPSNGV